MKSNAQSQRGQARRTFSPEVILNVGDTVDNRFKQKY